ncbi:carbohydrate sulfotransferase 11-like isoform X1 [Artemia franciscana]|uniref:Carbohydrate sulfotransferase n=1 Tax=Artemia franciscana TaxID=6661 RepID=A0AA88LBC1_ARTSF|nr:hypothetical protein QYM36_001501 [Artemia franciscana]
MQRLPSVQAMQRYPVKHFFLFPFFFLFVFIVVQFSSGPNSKSYDICNSSATGLSELKYNLKGLLEIQNNRKKRLTDICYDVNRNLLGFYGLNTRKLDHIISVDQQHLLYCYVPKVACTNWKRILMILSGNANTSDPLSIVANEVHPRHVWQTLADFNTSESQTRLNNYYKFMFVRHPFERLVSAYVNKFHKSYTDYFQIKYGREIVKNYRTNPEKEALARGHDVTFSEFVQYLIDPKSRERRPFDEHWRPMHELCEPCRIKYDIIGKYETLNEDSWLVLEDPRIDQKVKFPPGLKKSTASVVKSYLSQIPESHLIKLYYLYELDFKLFRYDFDVESDTNGL